MIRLKIYPTNMQRSRLLLFLLLCLVTVNTSACAEWLPANPLSSWFGGEEKPDRAALLSDVTMLTVDMYDTYYGESDTNLTDPPVWRVQAGADVVVNLINHGSFSHNWAIVKKDTKVPTPYDEGQNGSILLHGIGMVYHNSQTTVTFTAPEAGEYQVICTVSGHYPLMQGRLEVVADESE